MKETMNGRSSPKTLSKAFPVSVGNQIIVFILLALIGAAGVLIHAYLRIPMKLPGHHGVIYMTLLLSGKLISGRSYAASLSSIGAAAMLLVPLGFKDPFIPVIYLIPGYIVDILFYRFKNLQSKMVFLALICGLAYMSIPLLRIMITNVTGFPYGSLMGGFLYPILTHFMFGCAGGFIASGLYSAFRKKDK